MNSYSFSNSVDQYLESARILAIAKCHSVSTAWHVLDVLVRDHDPFWLRVCDLLHIRTISMDMIEANFSNLPLLTRSCLKVAYLNTHKLIIDIFF